MLKDILKPEVEVFINVLAFWSNLGKISFSKEKARSPYFF